MSEKKIGESSYRYRQAYDEHLYDRFVEIASLEAYEYLNGNKEYRDEQKQQFLEGSIENPVLDYPEINLERLAQAELDLLSMKKDIIEDEQNEAVRQAYRWRLNEKIAEIRMLKATANGDMRKFQRYSEFIYGKPTTEILNYTLSNVKKKAEDNIISDDESIKRVAKELLFLLPPQQIDVKIAELPDDNTINNARNQTIRELGSLINIKSDEVKLDAGSIQDAFESAISQIGDDRWQVVIDDKSSRTAVSVSQENMQVNIPQSRKVGRPKLEGLIVHEIGTHVARRVNGERSQLRLLGLGLDRYEAGDEGIATMREQAISKKVDDFKGFDGMLAIGLAMGLDGEPRDFRGVYEFLEKYYLLNNLIKGQPYEVALQKAQNTSWNRCVRTFRGTDCKTPGVCFTKDIIYREGSVGVWNVIKIFPEEMIHFNIGKYDPSNYRHIWILNQLGIREVDLHILEEEEEEEEEETREIEE